mmetsp:Transcript_56435/g.134511  ORF Transcript_56435/g.134511 Transcript_56435/m.134511 type:complete len:423 (-) Transcript_56435:97-1365(-)
MALVVKNTFLELDGTEASEPLKPTSSRASSLPRSFKVAADLDRKRFPSNASTASFDTASNGDMCCRTQSSGSCSWSDCSIDDCNSPHWPTSAWSPMVSVDGECQAQAVSSPCSAVTVAVEVKKQQEIFTVTLDHRMADAHGIDIDWNNGEYLLIERVKTSGLVADWNDKHPSEAIGAGCCIVEVNGLSGDAEKLLEEMKKEIILTVKVRTSPPPPKGKEPAAATKRTALRSKAPSYCPVSAQPSLATVEAANWQAPCCTRPELTEALVGLQNALISAVPADWWLEAGAPNGGAHISAMVPPFVSDPSIMVGAAQQTVLQIIAQYTNVFIIGRHSNPFKTIGQFGLSFSLVLAFLPTDKLSRACWDTYGKGFCPRPGACSWCHPEDGDLLEVQISLQAPAEQQFCSSMLLPSPGSYDYCCPCA